MRAEIGWVPGLSRNRFSIPANVRGTHRTFIAYLRFRNGRAPHRAGNQQPRKLIRA